MGGELEISEKFGFEVLGVGWVGGVPRPQVVVRIVIRIPQLGGVWGDDWNFGIFGRRVWLLG